MDIGAVIHKMTSPFLSVFFDLLKTVLLVPALLLIVLLLVFFVRYKLNPLRLNAQDLKKLEIEWKYFDLFRWFLVDFLERDLHRGEFSEYGFTFFVGRQGAGKTISMVRYLDVMKERYPHCLIVTNFQYQQSDYIMTDWRDLLTIRNGTDGIIFAIDEIHSEYDSSKWNDVPEYLLSEISQQRKQRIKIIASAQFFTRVAKPLREQAVTVVSCSTWLKRLTRNKEYDALEYALIIDNPLVAKKKIRPLRKSSFVQSDFLRNSYDTYEKIERMKNTKFIPRSERGRVVEG